jgi:hypothetical protein
MKTYYKKSGLYIEVVVKNTQALEKEAGFKRVRDKSIKVKFIYKGNDETFFYKQYQC